MKIDQISISPVYTETPVDKYSFILQIKHFQIKFQNTTSQRFSGSHLWVNNRAQSSLYSHPWASPGSFHLFASSLTHDSLCPICTHSKLMVTATKLLSIIFYVESRLRSRRLTGALLWQLVQFLFSTALYCLLINYGAAFPNPA